MELEEEELEKEMFWSQRITSRSSCAKATVRDQMRQRAGLGTRWNPGSAERRRRKRGMEEASASAAASAAAAACGGGGGGGGGGEGGAGGRGRGRGRFVGT